MASSSSSASRSSRLNRASPILPAAFSLGQMRKEMASASNRRSAKPPVVARARNPMRFLRANCSSPIFTSSLFSPRRRATSPTVPRATRSMAGSSLFRPASSPQMRE